MKFTYASGQRPLEGYTIKRGVGRGGFGEVYYAVSDGGKEVALKLVRGGEEDVELRGVAQCLNLKHPNLVDTYDLKTDGQNDHWVVMEYIAGETLGVVLHRHPHGLAPELARQWFLSLARAVGHLHEAGIVHRDLKPGNVFLENGQVKVGDYGLSKFISGSGRTAQTQSVGTVHYMAPEISTGNYNKQIDIYSAGIILYEMLTGHVPFEGESAGEILMKHLTTPPDLSKVPGEYRAVVGKALEKNPAQRYANMAEMIRAIQTVGQKEDRRAEPVALAVAVDTPRRPVSSGPTPPPRRPVLSEPILNALPAPTFGQQLVELCGSMSLTTLFAVVSTLVVVGVGRMSEWSQPGSIFFLTVAVCWAVLIPAKLWPTRRGDSWMRRAVMMVAGVLIGLGGLWLDARVPPVPPNDIVIDTGSGVHEGLLPPTGLSMVAGYMSYFGLTLFVMRWWKLADLHRRRWFGVGPIFFAGLWGGLLCLVFGSYMVNGLIALVASSIIIQLATPWEPPLPRPEKQLRLRCA